MVSVFHKNIIAAAHNAEYCASRPQRPKHKKGISQSVHAAKNLKKIINKYVIRRDGKYCSAIREEFIGGRHFSEKLSDQRKIGCEPRLG